MSFLLLGGRKLSTDEAEVVVESTKAIRQPNGGQIAWDWGTCNVGSTTSGWSVSIDTSEKYANFATLLVHTNGIAPSGGTTLISTIALPASRYVGGAKRLLLPVKVGDKGTSGADNNPIQIWLNVSAGGAHRMLSYVSRGGAADGDWLMAGPYDADLTGSGHITGTAEWAKIGAEEITSIRIVMTCAAGGINSSAPINIGPLILDAWQPPTITVFMDGHYSGQYSRARQILKSYGMRSSLSTIASWINVEAGTMSLTQMNNMYDDGHEMIHHTGNDVGGVGWNNRTKYPDGQEYDLVKADIKISQNYFRSRGWTRGLGYGVIGFTNGLSEPIDGSNAAQTLNRRQNITRAVRDGGLHTIRQLGGFTQSHFVHSNHCPLVTQVTPIVSTSVAVSAATVQGYIDKLKLRGGWMGLTYHDIVLSGETGNNRNVSAFEADIDYLYSSGVRVLPFSEAVSSLAAPRNE